MKHDKYLSGLALMLGSALLFSTAGIFTKAVAASGWEVIFWRALFSAMLTAGLLLWRGRWAPEVTRMGRSGLLAAVIGASGTAAFLSAFKLTGVANVALIYSATPMVAALLAWVILREAPGIKMLAGAALGILGILVILAGSLGEINLLGDLLALVMALALALLFVLYRARPETPSIGPTLLSCLFLLPIALLFSDPRQTPLVEIGVMACFGLVFAAASVLMFEAAKRLPSGQAGLISNTETPFAILLAWVILGELPVTATVIGGTLVLIGVVLGSLPRRRAQRGRTPSMT
ncbi:DMT family transporter [Roseovarius sp. C7]|uniref:DMT family transporter n=1 Tax=Roseovarius sp. C7 TaxID=3398643 RepID=UPI0039F71E05